MTFRACSYERELTQALKDGHWPEGCGPELRAHVDACGHCSDLVLVTETFQRVRSESEHATPCGSPSLLWWRAQLRRRYAATERVSRPITIAQIFAWLVTVLVGIVFVASQYHHGLHWAAWWPEVAPARILHVLSIAPIGNGQLDPIRLLLLFAFGVLLLFSALVVYLASEKF
jgi:hypothetical protein